MVIARTHSGHSTPRGIVRATANHRKIAARYGPKTAAPRSFWRFVRDRGMTASGSIKHGWRTIPEAAGAVKPC